ncbi:MAG: TadE/TadG family type IV pilus assembly protein [Hyphomicrobium sp.]
MMQTRPTLTGTQELPVPAPRGPSRRVRRRMLSRARFARHIGGAAAVEAAFVLPLVIAGVVFIAELGNVLYSKVEFEYAVHSATRIGMVMASADTAKMRQTVANNFVLLDATKLGEFSMSETVNADSTRTAVLTVSYEVEFLTPVIDHSSITLTRSVSFLRGP